MTKIPSNTKAKRISQAELQSILDLATEEDRRIFSIRDRCLAGVKVELGPLVVKLDPDCSRAPARRQTRIEDGIGVAILPRAEIEKGEREAVAWLKRAHRAQTRAQKVA